jgi:branched-chain amino acid transport system ATP-binding protein
LTDQHHVKIKIENISLSFGGITALKDISLEIRDNEILAIIGPNGAGKTCILNSINGFYKPQQGAGHRPYLPEHRAILRADHPG